MLEIGPPLIDRTKNIVLVGLKGVIDSSTAPDLKKFLAKIIAEGVHTLVLNLSQIDYIASSGWSVILGKLLELRDVGGDLFLLEMQPAVIAVFKLMGLDVSVRHYDSLPDLIDEMALDLVEMPNPVGRDKGVAPERSPGELFRETIQKIVEEHPRWGSRMISRELSKKRAKPVTAFQIFQELRKMGLHTEQRRISYADKKAKRKGDKHKGSD